MTLTIDGGDLDLNGHWVGDYVCCLVCHCIECGPYACFCTERLRYGLRGPYLGCCLENLTDRNH